MFPKPSDIPGDAVPPHAYVPGQTERHQEGWFDQIRDTAQSSMSAKDLAASKAFQTGLAYIGGGYFWEAHEVLEPVWLALPVRTPERQVVQALIQYANARLKLGMDRPKAAIRLCGIVRSILEALPVGLIMGVDPVTFQCEVDSLERQIKLCNKIHK